MISRRRFLGGVAASSAALGAPFVVGCKKSGSNEIVLGAILGLSGENSSLGVETKEGIEMALDEINAAGGYKGRKIKVLYEDTRLDPNLASEKIQKLIDRDRVLCVMGDAASTPTLSAAAYAEKAKVPLISPSATNVEVTRNKKYVFRICFTDDKQGSAAAKFAREELKAEKAAVIYVTGNKYSEGLQAIFTRDFEKAGGKVIAKETFQAEETNVLTFLTKIKEAGPQIIFAPVYPADVAKIGPTKLRVGMADIPLLGTDGWDGPATRAKGVIESIEGCYFTDLFAAEGPNPRAKPFVDKYKGLHNKLPSSLVAGGYDVLKLVLDAIGRAKAENSDAIRDAIEATKAFEGVTGTFDIDAEHNAQKPVTVMKITGGDFKYHTQIKV
jgi:branched-chain amino acid transport system substrate-binding protein